MKRVSPRHGSMGVWPRKRANRSYARVRGWKGTDGLLAFPAYKAGMTHVMATDAGKNSPTKGQTLSIPVTILECPPIKIYSIRCYTEDAYGKHVAKEIVVGKDKNLFRKLFTNKTDEAKVKEIKPEEYVNITVTIMTMPSKTNIGQKKPEIMEFHIGGKPQDQLAWAQERIGKEIPITEVFKEGEYVDCHGVTTGKGFQGAVKRFGVNLKNHKSEKGQRGIGSLGGWSGQQHFMYRNPAPGQMGYHQRVQFNNLVLKISDNPEEVKIKGGIRHYGEVKSSYLLVKGSLQGAKKRVLTLTKPMRLYERSKMPLPTIELISLESQQGR